MKEFGRLNILKPQLFSEQEEQQAITNTMTLDYQFGHIATVQKFAEKFSHSKPWVAEHNKTLGLLSKQELREEAENAKPKSLLMTPIMLTGECNANCTICYTDRKKKPNELTYEEIEEIIEQTRKLGSKTIYIAGEGEPSLDKSFLDIVDYSKKNKMDMLVFTNGTLLSNERLCMQRTGMQCAELADRLAEAPVYIYHKLWSTEPKKVRELMGLTIENDYSYTDYSLQNGTQIKIPKGLSLLMSTLPKERLGIEAVIERRTGDEVAEKIIPFIEENGLKSYVEPLIHSGKNFDRHEFDPTPEQIEKNRHYLVRQGCTRIAYMFAVHNNGYATPGISVLPNHLKFVEDPEGLNVRKDGGGLKNLFEMRHTHPFLVNSRYNISGCFCEEFNLMMAESGKVRLKWQESSS